MSHATCWPHSSSVEAVAGHGPAVERRVPSASQCKADHDLALVVGQAVRPAAENDAAVLRTVDVDDPVRRVGGAEIVPSPVPVALTVNVIGCAPAASLHSGTSRRRPLRAPQVRAEVPLGGSARTALVLSDAALTPPSKVVMVAPGGQVYRPQHWDQIAPFTDSLQRSLGAAARLDRPEGGAGTSGRTLNLML